MTEAPLSIKLRPSWHILAQVGDVVNGKISSIQPYGAFVNFGGANDGLLHVSQISHDRVSNLEAVFSVGDVIKVRP